MENHEEKWFKHAGFFHCVWSRQTILQDVFSYGVRVCVCAFMHVCARAIHNNNNNNNTSELHSTAAGRPVNYLTNYCFTYLSCLSHIPTGNIQIYDADRDACWPLFLTLHLFPHCIRTLRAHW